VVRTLAAFLAVAVLASLGAPGRSQGLTTVRISTVPIDAGAEVYYAKEMGFFARAGIEVEPSTGIIRNITRGREYQAAAFPPFMQSLIDAGGLQPYVEKRLAER